MNFSQSFVQFVATIYYIDSYFALTLSMHDKWLKKHNENMIYYILH